MSNRKWPEWDYIPYAVYLMAEDVAQEPYTEREFSPNLRSSSHIEKVEAKRQKLTPEQIDEFADWCERRCKHAHERKSKWWVKIINMEDGRDQLRIWFSHWLAAYLNNPEVVRQESRV